MRPDNKKKQRGSKGKSSVGQNARSGSAVKGDLKLESNADRYADTETARQTTGRSYSELLSQTQFSQAGNDVIKDEPSSSTEFGQCLDLSTSAVISAIDELPLSKLLCLPASPSRQEGQREEARITAKVNTGWNEKSPGPAEVLYRNSGQTFWSRREAVQSEVCEDGSELDSVEDQTTPGASTQPMVDNKNEAAEEDLGDLEDWLDSVLDT